jgi:hypothetical protein
MSSRSSTRHRSTVNADDPAPTLAASITSVQQDGDHPNSIPARNGKDRHEDNHKEGINDVSLDSNEPATMISNDSNGNPSNTYFSDKDILCAKGGIGFRCHPGNKRYLEIVGRSTTNYQNSKEDSSRQAVLNSVLDEIRSNGARFMVKVNADSENDGPCDTTNSNTTTTDTWVVLDTAKIKQKLRKSLQTSKKTSNINTTTVVEKSSAEDDQDHGNRASRRRRRRSAGAADASTTTAATTIPASTASMPQDDGDYHDLDISHKHDEHDTATYGIDNNASTGLEEPTTMASNNNNDSINPSNGGYHYRDHDILCEQRKIGKHHPGNLRFRKIVARHSMTYVLVQHKGEDGHDNTWVEWDDGHVRKKLSSALRKKASMPQDDGDSHDLEINHKHDEHDTATDGNNNSVSSGSEEPTTMASNNDDSDNPSNGVDYLKDNDILCETSKIAMHHPGNQRFRKIVKQFRLKYQQAEIGSGIRRALLNKMLVEIQSNGQARFLVQHKGEDEDDNTWVEWDDVNVRKKLRSALSKMASNSTSAASVTVTTSCCSDDAYSNRGQQQGGSKKRPRSTSVPKEKNSNGSVTEYSPSSQFSRKAKTLASTNIECQTLDEDLKVDDDDGDDRDNRRKRKSGDDRSIVRYSGVVSDVLRAKKSQKVLSTHHGDDENARDSVPIPIPVEMAAAEAPSHRKSKVPSHRYRNSDGCQPPEDPNDFYVEEAAFLYRDPPFPEEVVVNSYVLVSQLPNNHDNNSNNNNGNSNYQDERPEVVEKVDRRKNNNIKDDNNQDSPNEECPSSSKNWLYRLFFDLDQILQENDETDHASQEEGAADGGPKKKKINNFKMAVWFPKFVKKDFPLAETIYVGVIGLILVILTRGVLRMQLYGADYGVWK